MKKQKARSEKFYSDRIATKLGGVREVKTPAGKIDVLTKNEVIEVKRLEGWKGGIGQAISYASYYPDRNPRLHLIGSPSELLLKEIAAACKRSGVVLTFEPEEPLVSIGDKQEETPFASWLKDAFPSFNAFIEKN